MSTKPEDTHVVTALVRKRAELAGQIEYGQIQLRKLIGDLDNIDASIRIFAPDLATETIKPKPAPPQHQALRGVVKATILDVLRDADGPVTTETFAAQLMKDRCLPDNNPAVRKLLINRVGAALHVLRDRGTVRRAELPGRFNGWELAPVD